jgi:glucosamine kinase
VNNICIGVEGGGTNTRVLVAIGTEPPIFLERRRSIKFGDDDYTHSAQTLIEILSEVPNFDTAQISAIAIGLSGASNKNAQTLYQEAIRAILGDPNLPIHIEGDASLTLNVALEENEAGMLLIAGTGSALLARNEHGEVHLFGGLGPDVGDEGSGYWIGHEVLQHFHVSESNGNTDQLSDAVREHLSDQARNNPELLTDLIQARLIRPSEFAPIVFMLSVDDANAGKIIREAAHHLGALVRQGANYLHLEHGADLHLTGSIAKQPEMLRALGDDVRDLGLVFREVEEDAPVKKALAIARELLNKT